MIIDRVRRTGSGRGKVALVAMPILLIAAFLWAGQEASQAGRTVIDGQPVHQVQYTATFAEDALIFGELLGYDTVSLRDGDYLNEPGKPMLPAKEFRIALPAGMAVTNVRLVDARAVALAGEYAVFPAQPPRRTADPPATDILVPPDAGAYASADPYPARLVEFVQQGDLAGQGMAVVRVYPVQYVAAERRLTLYTSIAFVVEGVDGYECGDYLPARLSQRSAATYGRLVAQMVVNPEDVELRQHSNPPRQSRGVGPGDYDYVIITADGFVGEFQPLADWRTKRGTPATAVGIGWILAEYSGADDEEKVRNFVIDAHTNWGTMYFLLGGEDETIPFKYRTYDEENTPSDQYYSDFDDDWVHEVFVGRVTAGNSTQIDRVINTILTYEQTPPASNYGREALLIGMDLDAVTESEDLKEDIAGYITAYDAGFGITKVYDSYAENHKDVAISALNAGKNLVNHSDHCNTTVMGVGSFNHGWDLFVTDIGDLTNDGELSVVVSTGCHPNEMDYDDCIAEYWVIRNTNRAGVAFTGSTRNGYYYAGNPVSLTGVLDKQWWRGLFEQNTYILGETLIFSKHNFGHGTNQNKHCEWTFNLLGDPAMPMWTADPQDITIVTYDDPIGGGEQIYIVHVEDGSGNLEDATVCLWKAGEVYGVNDTNSVGNASFVISPTTEGTMYVTVTKRNYRPYMGSAEVVLPYYTLTVNIDGQGIVIKDPNQPDYLEGETVELTAYPFPDWSFDHWSGDLEGSANPEYIYMDGNKTVTAHMVEDGDDCPEDLTGDEHVGLADLAALLANYGQTGMGPEDGDFNGDTVVDIQDLAQLLGVYGQDCPTH
jgi:hypothetical protein